MGRSRAVPIGAFIVVLISGAPIDLARGGDLVECEPQRVTGDGRHWAYRIVDGRECWYPGRPGKPKNELFWGRGTTLSAHQTVDQPETETEPSEPPSRFVGAPPEQPETTEAMPGAQLPPTKEAGRRPGLWPCYRSGSSRCGGLPSQDEDYGLFVPEMLAE
jgi:hypothetical protein